MLKREKYAVNYHFVIFLQNDMIIENIFGGSDEKNHILVYSAIANSLPAGV